MAWVRGNGRQVEGRWASNAGDTGLIPESGRSPGEGIATHSSTLAWKTPWTVEPGGLYSPWGCKESDMPK